MKHTDKSIQRFLTHGIVACWLFGILGSALIGYTEDWRETAGVVLYGIACAAMGVFTLAKISLHAEVKDDA